MFTSICNFLYDKFFHRSEFKLLHRKNDSNESLSRKRLKLTDYCFDSNSPSQDNFSPFSMQGDNAKYGDDEECCIIAEMPRRKKAGSSINVDQGDIVVEDSPKYSKVLQSWPSISSFGKNPSEESNKDVQEINCVSNTPKRNLIATAEFKNKFFNNLRTPLSQGKMAKSRTSFKNHLKKKLNFLKESYRLTEKLQYMKLLESQVLLTLQSKRPSPGSIKYSNESIPVIDLTDEKTPTTSEDYSKSGLERQTSDQDVQIVGEFTGVKSFQDILKIKPINTEETLEGILSRDSKTTPNLLKSKELSDHTICLLDDDTDEDYEEGDCDNKNSSFDTLEEKLKSCVKITCPVIQKVKLQADDFKVPYVFELTKEQEMKIANALIPEPKQEVLVKGFGLHITRHDMQTLKGLNWLNDVVIDFYMNLIVERSKLNNDLPKVYAFNTFFYPKLVSSGYDGLQRWTKQVDIFLFDMILVPIHLGMHWCLSVIDFRSKSVQYYDSIGSPNDSCLEKLLLYLKAESLCKKKTVFPTSNWEKRNVKDIPQQMNGSDCGVFSCMFAEFLSRDCSITFSQGNMPYFRKKMVIEILEKRLLS